MADEPDIAPVFRTVFEERAALIVALLDEPALTGGLARFPHLRSFDYTGGGLVFIGHEMAESKPMRFELSANKVSDAYVRRELPKAITAFDMVA